jgi:hypothetical protein
MDFSPYDPDSPKEKQKQAARERLARERRRRAHVSMFALPPFETPSDSELRRLYRAYRDNPEVRRLILEVQCARYSILEISAMAAECHWDLTKERANLRARCLVGYATACGRNWRASTRFRRACSARFFYDAIFGNSVTRSESRICCTRLA